MKKEPISFFLSVFFLSWLGCEQMPPEAVSPAPQAPRLKITDLAPSDQSYLTTIQCAFSVIVYRLPMEKVAFVPESLKMLSTKPLAFSDPKGFIANGFWAGSGIQPLGPEVTQALSQLGAERMSIKKLLLFQDYPEEMTGFPIEPGRSVVYFREDGMPVGKQVPGGRLSLVLRAKPDTPRKGIAAVQIEPLFQPSVYMNVPVPSREWLYESISFKEGRLQTTLSEGDFVVLAAAKIQQDSNTLSGFFVDSQRKEPTALLYLIVCQRAGE